MEVLESVSTGILVSESCAEPSLDVTHLEPKGLDRARGNKLLHLLHRVSHLVDSILKILRTVLYDSSGWAITTMVNAVAVSVLEVGDKVESVGESERDGYACETV